MELLRMRFTDKLLILITSIPEFVILCSGTIDDFLFL